MEHLSLLCFVGMTSFAWAGCLNQPVTQAKKVLENMNHPCHRWAQGALKKTILLEGGLGALAAVAANQKSGLLITARHVSQDYESGDAENLSMGAFGDLTNLKNLPGGRTGPLALWRLSSPDVFSKYLEMLTPTVPIREDYAAYLFTAANQLQSDTLWDVTPETIDQLDAKVEVKPFEDLSKEKAKIAQVLVVGHPRFTRDSEPYWERQASYDEGQLSDFAIASGDVMSDEEAENFTKQSFRRSDELPQMLYRADSDLYLKIRGAPGFSGGGVFDTEGRLIGVISIKMKGYVRGKPGPIYVLGAVRLSYVTKILTDRIDSIPREFSTHIRKIGAISRK
ncbi:MAG: trypsin-like peptidase domain-containing protein [Deltaproteobacteria bacterium]|nr:trypsin-like peptidase domain-containing protein [Deltaproteobacteria bacterium]